ncbi:hypothetical protein F53441_13296 [Fusarium austroafricanum]|uniref:Uncharacterized protein n=1 Tax=Fusarium austroafricanum TaxID=2364996 RepID=A0A8H4JP19_9HYPO|nr:hypothetical protein F53441_13296 [Fusarium austroafricanum]
MTLRRRNQHRLCKSEETENTGRFSVEWIGDGPNERDRRVYMISFLHWMRKRTLEERLQLQDECEKGSSRLVTLGCGTSGVVKNISPLPIFPWEYTGPPPVSLGTSPLKTYGSSKSLQASILRRVDPDFVPPTGQHLLLNEDLTTAQTAPSLRSSGSALTHFHASNSAKTSRQRSITTFRISPTAIRKALRYSTKSVRSASPHKTNSSPIVADTSHCQDVQNKDEPNGHGNDMYNESGKRETPHRNDQKDEHAEQNEQVSVSVPSPQKRPRLESATQPRSAIALTLDRIANMSAELYCVENQYLDLDLIAWIIMMLGEDGSRRLFGFLNHGTLNAWYCLRSIVSEPLRDLIALEDSQKSCVTHGLRCTRVMVIRDDDGCRRLKFETVYDDEV